MLLNHNMEVYGQLEDTLSEKDKAIVIMGTGVGKTYVTKEYIEKHSKHPLIVAPRTSICKSWAKTVKGCVAITYQKLSKNYEGIDFSKYDLIVYDEVHHIMAATWLKAAEYVSANYDIKTIGLTADSVRYTDGCVDVGVRFFDGNFCYGESISSAIEKKILNPIKYVGAFYNTDGIKSEFKGKVTEKLYAKLDLAINQTPTVEDIIKENIGEGKKKGIIFAPSIDDMDDAISFVLKAMPGYEARKISSKMPDSENNANLEWFNGAESGFLCSVNMVSEGVHIDGVNMLVMLRRTMSPTLFIQQLGRCLSSKSKERSVVFDFVNNKFNVGTMAHKARRDKSMIDETSEMLSKTSKQLIIKNYAKEIVEVLNEIKESLSSRITWTDEEIEILKNNYGKMGMACSALLPRHSSLSIRGEVNKLGLHMDGISKWTEEERRTLAENYGKVPMDEMCEMLKRHNKSLIMDMARRMGFRISGREKRVTEYWTEEEEKTLAENYDKMPYSELSKMLGRTKNAISRKIKFMGLETKVKQLTNKEKRFIAENCGSMSYGKMSKKLGISIGRIRLEMKRNGFKKERDVHHWTEDEIRILVENHDKKGKKELADMFGMDENAVQRKLLSMKLKVKRIRRGNGEQYTKEEDEFILSNLGKMTYKEMSKAIGRSKSSISVRVRKLKRKAERNDAE